MGISYHLKKSMVTAAAVAAAAAVALCPAAYAKTDAYIDYNISRMRSLLSESEFKVYAEAPAEQSVYYGAKFEPRSGVYIGTPGNCKFNGIDNAIDTEYDWLVLSDEIRNENYPREEKAEAASNHTQLIGVNWNFASRYYVDLSDYSNYIYNYIDRLAARGSDILLIFGKEFNIDDNFLDEDVFINAFRFVADYAHTKQNIAMVWAPNDTGGLDTRLQDFYPGDEYVDWIGCSLYSMPYFQGNPYAPEDSNVGFIMGPYANPVMRAKVIAEFMEEYNINKPVFITEGGVGYQSPDGEDFTEWSMQQLRRYYGEMVRRYPQFKCIVSFNNYHAAGDYYRYDMGNNPILLEQIQQLTQDPIYIKKYPETSPVSYAEFYDGMEIEGEIKLSAYAYETKAEWLEVKYIIDGSEVGSSMYPPYNLNLTSDTIPYGEHSLRAEMYLDGELMRSRSFDFLFKEGQPKPDVQQTPVDSAYVVYADAADNGMCGFADMADKPNEMRNAVGILSHNGIISGTGDNNFSPDTDISRAQFASIMLRMTNKLDSAATATFTDVSKDDWFYSAVASSQKEGIISGFPDNTFRAAEAITKNQISSVMARTISSYGISPKGAAQAQVFTDGIAEWAADAVNYVTAQWNLIPPRSDGSFAGDAPVKRGDAAVMLYRLYEVIKDYVR